MNILSQQVEKKYSLFFCIFLHNYSFYFYLAEMHHLTSKAATGAEPDHILAAGARGGEAVEIHPYALLVYLLLLLLLL